MSSDPLHNLTKTAHRFAELDAQVLWWRDGEWDDADEDLIEAEEMPFYAEGMLMEGFSCAWQVLGDEEGPAGCRLYFWTKGDSAPLPALPEGFTLLASGQA